MGKPSPPPAPDYTPFITASQNAATSDAEAAKVQAEIAREQMGQQDRWAAASNVMAQNYYNMAVSQNKQGQEAYADIKPYLQEYMNSQARFTTAAEANLSDQMESAALARAQAKDTYDRYLRDFAPREAQFVNEAFGWATPARMEQDAAAARGDVATAFNAQRDAATRQLASYGIDPTQGRYHGATQAMDISQAAAAAAAGTMARKQTEQQGKQYELAALQIGRGLPGQAIGQAGLGNQSAAGGLAGASIGGGGISAGGGLMNAATNAMGSPTAYAQLSNPYTSLADVYSRQATSLFGNQITGLGNVAGAISAGSGAMNNSFSNQMQGYQQQSANNASLWGGLGRVAGMAMPFVLSDRRAKTDIKKVNTLDNGLVVYSFKYVGDPVPRVGLLADEVERIHPEAIAVDEQGYKRVNYSLAVGETAGALPARGR